MRFSSKAALFSLLTVFSASCTDDNPEAKDTTSPSIQVVNPSENSTFARGGAIHFEAIFEDETELATYNITIHENDDAHSHARRAASAFSFDRSFNISGKRAVVNQTIDIPADAETGAYHFIIKAIDKAGNATSFSDGSTKEIDILIAE
jgi:hypothetical protein